MNTVDQAVKLLYSKIDWSLIPSHMWPGVKEWIEFGTPGGSFMMAIMEHDFYNAIFAADVANKACIVEWAQFLCWYLPSNCHGSPEKVKNWHQNGGLRGIMMSQLVVHE